MTPAGAAVVTLFRSLPATDQAEVVAELTGTPIASAPTVDPSSAEVARELGRSPTTLATWCRTGLLPGAYRCRQREWRIPRATLERFQREQAAAA